jgi:ABC-type multidrug transport system ATPase subunit
MTARETGSGPEALLEVRGVRKSYGRRQVLRDVSFELPKGRIVGITGENGAGKTTLLRIIVGLLAPDAGVVRGAARSGYCPQELAVFEPLTVRENFRFFAAAYGLEGGVAGEGPPWTKTMDELCARFRFAAYQNALVSTLSGGTKQKLNFCLSVLHHPGVLILDEPYAGFDWETYVRFWEFAEERKSSGLSAIIVSHFVYDTSKFDAILELREGVLRCV